MEESELRTYRQTLIEGQIKMYRAFDTALLSVSSGAVVLSVTYISNQPLVVSIGFLNTAWGFWFVSILCQLVSYLVSALAFRVQMDLQKKHWLIQLKESVLKWFGVSKPSRTESTPSAVPTNPVTAIVHYINTVSLLAFFLGCLAFFMFVHYNLTYQAENHLYILDTMQNTHIQPLPAVDLSSDTISEGDDSSENGVPPPASPHLGDTPKGVPPPPPPVD